jgi:hypothetical protein
VTFSCTKAFQPIQFNIHRKHEKILAAKEQKLAKMWADSKVIKTAIGILEGKEQDDHSNNGNSNNVGLGNI